MFTFDYSERMDHGPEYELSSPLYLNVEAHVFEEHEAKLLCELLNLGIEAKNKQNENS